MSQIKLLRKLHGLYLVAVGIRGRTVSDTVSIAETECSKKKIDYGPHGKHNHHPNYSPQHVLFAFRVISSLLKIPQKYDEPPQKKQEPGSKDDLLRRRDYFARYLLQNIANYRHRKYRLGETSWPLPRMG